jgi:hypothetical protein
LFEGSGERLDDSRQGSAAVSDGKRLSCCDLPDETGAQFEASASVGCGAIALVISFDDQLGLVGGLPRSDRGGSHLVDDRNPADIFDVDDVAFSEGDSRFGLDITPQGTAIVWRESGQDLELGSQD